MKLAVHCAPLVNVWTPGWTAALSAGAHAPAAGTMRSSAHTAAATVTTASLRAFKVLPPACEIVLPAGALPAFSGDCPTGREVMHPAQVGAPASASRLDLTLSRSCWKESVNF